MYVGALSRSKCLHIQYSAVTQRKESTLATCNAMTDKKIYIIEKTLKSAQGEEQY